MKTTPGNPMQNGPADPTSSKTVSVGPKEEASLKEVVDKVAAQKQDAEKASLLGDLHLKQGKNEQAATSFAEALKLYLDASEMLRRAGMDLKGTPSVDGALEKELILTASKLLQVYTTAGNGEAVKKLVKTLEQHVQTVTPGDKPPKAEASTKSELAAKLVISAPKKLLDLAGSGKITFEEFRKGATVDYQPARTIEK